MNIGEFTFYNWQIEGFMWLWIGLAIRAAHSLQQVAAVGMRESWA
jgi:hypothetical protein